MLPITYILPELFLSVSVMVILMVGVFIKKSFKLVNLLTILVLIFTVALVLNQPDEIKKIFNESYIVDKFSIFMKVLTLSFSLFVLLTSSDYVKNNGINKIEYPIIILFSVVGMMLMISSYDLIIFYLSLELQSLCLYVLASFNRNNLKSTEAGLKYFVLSALASGLLLYGSSLVYGFTGSTNFEIISKNLIDESTGATFGIVFIIVGLAFKVSAVPFHMWTPDVYEGAPTSITAFFAIVPKVAAIVLIFRFCLEPFINFYKDWSQIIIFLSIGSMFLGSIAAIAQSNLKRLLAYSSIGHVGYVLIALAAANEDGVKALIIYMILYMIMNIAIFGLLLSLKTSQGFVEKIDDLSGISKSNPIIGLSFAIILLSMAGIPPFMGFFGKFYVFIAALNQGLVFLSILGVLASVISAYYYLRIIKVMYFDELKLDYKYNFSISFESRIIIIIFILVITLFVFYPSLLINYVSNLRI